MPQLSIINQKIKTYLQNKAKWEAAIRWCNEKGFDFKVYTEDTLEKMGII